MEPTPKPKRARSKGYSRRKGVTGEQDWVNRFKEEFGDIDPRFLEAKTTRNASKLLDDCGVDIAFVPLNPQIKVGYAKALPRADKLFLEMRELLLKNFPVGHPQHELMKLVVYHIGDFRHHHNVLVTMMWKDWKEIYKDHLKWKSYQNAKETEQIKQSA